MKGSMSYSMDQSNRLYLNITWTRLSIQPVNSVIQSFPTCCNPMDCSTPGFPAHHQPLELKLMSVKSVMPSSHLILCHPLLFLPSIFPASGSFPLSQFFASGGQSIGVSASASVLPINIQDWFPSGCTGWISLQSKGLSMEYYSAIKKHIWISSNEVDETGTYCTEWSKSERKTPIRYINAYIWNLERWLRRPYMRQQKRHRYKEQTFGLCGRRRGWDDLRE